MLLIENNSVFCGIFLFSIFSNAIIYDHGDRIDVTLSLFLTSIKKMYPKTLLVCLYSCRGGLIFYA